MASSQCPVCDSPLETRVVTPCDICGGWPEMVESFDPTATFMKFRLPSGPCLVVCRSCELEEFMVRGGWGDRLTHGAALPINAIHPVQTLEQPRLQRDKFCPTCNIRLALAEVIANIARQSEVDSAQHPADDQILKLNPSTDS